MLKLHLEEHDTKSDWFVIDKHDMGLNQDRMTYHCVIEMVANKHLKGKRVYEAYGGVGMSSYRYLKYCKFLLLNDIDPNSIACAKRNLRKYGKSVEYQISDFVEAMKSEKRKFDFVDFDNYTPLSKMAYDNMPDVLNVLGKNAIGFLFTDTYQFLLSRNFQHMYSMLEEKFNAEFKDSAIDRPEHRCELWANALGKAISKQTKGKYVLSEIWLRNNVDRMLFLRKDLADKKTIKINWLRNFADVEKIMKELRSKSLLDWVGGSNA